MTLAPLLCFLSVVLPVKPDSIVSYFDKIVSLPEEKVYVQTDKSDYGAGENIWFKGYLVSAINHREDQSWSNYLYVDLLSRADSVIVSKKVRRQRNVFAGNIKLDAALPPGDYYIHSYTNWMRNEDPSSHFYKMIRVGNLVNDVNATVTYTKQDANDIVATVNFLNGKSVPDHQVKIRYVYYDGKKLVRKGTAKTAFDGTMQMRLPLVGAPRINVVVDDPSLTYKSDLYPTIRQTDYSVTFFPEGGDLLPLQLQKVAFKAQASNGYSIPVNGVVKNQKGEVVANISTVYDGMGLFYLSPQNGDVFHAEVQSSDGVTNNFDLPLVHDSGFKLKAASSSRSINYEVLKTDDVNWPDTLYVVAHQRGCLRSFRLINAQHPGYDIPDSLFTDGIVHLLLLDKYGKAISERLLFVYNKNRESLTAVTDKGKYDKREKVNVEVDMKDAAGCPQKGDLSVCVTDNSLVTPDSIQANIVSDLLLTSDLKGYIEHPTNYFSPDNKLAKAELDLLMMTNGWRRFKTGDLSVKPDMSYKYYVENVETFGGTVSGLFGKTKKAQVTAFAPSKGIISMVTADNKGHFYIQSSREYPDSVTFVVAARTAKGRNGVTIKMDNEETPQTASNILYPVWNNTAFSDEYAEKAREEYYREGGMKVIKLKEVTVSASKVPQPGDPNYEYITNSDHSMTGDQLKDYQNMTAYQIIQLMPGITTAMDDEGGEILKFNRSKGRAMLIINDMRYDQAADYSMLQTINGSDIQRIDLVNNGIGLVTLGSTGNNGAIVITLKSIEALNNSRISFNPVRFTPRGYNESVEFYAPVYDTPEAKDKKNSDFRSTIYWNPSLATDANGKASFSYYTNDGNASENMIIEGVTSTGNPVYFEKNVDK